MTDSSSQSIEIHADIATKLNYASHQSAFPMLRNLWVENLHAEHPIDRLILRVQTDPKFIHEKVWHVDRIAAQGSVSISDRDLQVSGSFLLNLTESVSGTVAFSLERDGLVLTEISKPIELLAYNEWGGTGFMPELLAAFSMPNDPAIDKIIRSASEVLRRAGKHDGIDGYKSGSRQRVWEIISAIYTAIANLGLTYAVPPASFEIDGQRIRLPSQILEGRIATCLDTAMLFSSAFEQAGLNPIIALPKGHALVGAWLQPEELSNVVIDEAETLRKRVDLQELALVETTFAVHHRPPPFSRAFDAAKKIISPEDDDTFVAAVDIRRARAHAIHPLGLLLESSGPIGEPMDAAQNLELEASPSLPDFDSPKPEETRIETAEGRLERWQRHLLDLSLRNPLLSHRSAKTSLQIICPDPSQLEDKLATRSRIQIVSAPNSDSPTRDEEVHQQRTGELITEEYAKTELGRGRVLVSLPSEELSKRTVGIYRKAQTALQEGGANTLYLALGFLVWRRNDKEDRRFRAPLILLPVSLERQSVRSGIRMVAHDDEPRFNTTLLEMLRRDFRIDIQGLDGELPGDDKGVDVTGIWNRVRAEFRDTPGFEVVEDVVLGHFSFAKYLMWKDLVDRSAALRENAVVRHLIDTPRDPFPSEIGFVDPSKLDQEFEPADLLTPLSADSSQMAAIATAHRGKDFIIIGPPGTGKSQTIANMIAHTLGQGKTVLFVSEKTAALEVVYRRLNEIGLGRYCLQLHSNKSNKADVLKQLRDAWDRPALESPENWREQGESLRTLRDRLNQLVDRLHRKHRNGLTAHYALGVKVRDGETAARVALSWPRSDQHSEADLKRVRESVDWLAVQAKAVGEVSSSPFRFIKVGDWAPAWEDQVMEQSARLSAAAGSVAHARDALCSMLDLSLPDHSAERLDYLGQLANLLLDCYQQQTAYALEPDAQGRIDALKEAAIALRAYHEAQSSLSCEYDPFAWRTLDGEHIGRLWAAAQSKWWLMRWLAEGNVASELKKNGARGNPNPAVDAKVLTRMRREGERIDQLDRQLSEFRAWSRHTTDPSSLEGIRSVGERSRAVVGKLADDLPAPNEIRTKIREILRDGNHLLAPDAVVGRAAIAFRNSLENLRLASREFEASTGSSAEEMSALSDQAPERIQESADIIITRRNELREWCAWWKRRSDAIEADLLPLVEALEQGDVLAGDLRGIFETAYCVWWSKAVFEEDVVLRSFSTPEHEATILKFQEVDNEFQRTTARYVVGKLASSLPDQNGVKTNSEWGVVRRELQKQRRHKPVRQLLKEAPDAMTSLAPCFMMSPLSVAQYLSPDQAMFDLVIFDEASQITVWDAIGSIARGRQVIVVGDPKQMPPSNFFERSDDDPDGDIDEDGDLESILEEMLGSGIPDRTLNLHYRSRNESLITFSNSHYYDDQLITFPAPDAKSCGVSLIRPGGFYARGSARHNQGEANAIVEEIVRRLTHADPAVRNLSIGVVTFNSQQQTLIENLLDEARDHQPEIEWAFSPDATEPVFVKNLETVQGDERDVILFSVTYGPDQSGRVTMNFGPLNRQGGERRLNVAMTRARSEMIVFSTLEPNQIDLSRSTSAAVRDLKQFLDYAENGASGLRARASGPGADFESPFEVAVADELRSRGWRIEPQVGDSAYRIDLGVVHPDESGRYLVGIECDGAMYHSSAVARERDKIRQSVLEGLGWTLIRVWSTDWWNNKPKALEDLDVQIHQLLEADRNLKQNSAQASADRETEECDDCPVAGGMDMTAVATVNPLL